MSADEHVWQEIVEQAAIARRCARVAAPRWPRASGRVVIVGSGDSFCAAELAGVLYREGRVEGLSALAGSAAACRLGPDDALIGVSISGRTPRVREAVLRARARGAHTVAVTDDPAGPLAGDAHEVWPLCASPAHELGSTSYTSAAAAEYVGYHHDVAQTKTFFAAVSTIARAAEAALGGTTDWERLAATVERLCGSALADPIARYAPECARAGHGYVLGGATTLPLARFGAYKLLELDRPATASDVEEYCHTHYFVTRTGDAVAFVLADADAARRAAEVAPVLAELFAARLVALRSDDVEPVPGVALDVAVPAGGSALERHVALLVAVEWLGYLWGRVGAPDPNTFHGGHDTERLVGASVRTIRRSRIVVDQPDAGGS